MWIKITIIYYFSQVFRLADEVYWSFPGCGWPTVKTSRLFPPLSVHLRFTHISGSQLTISLLKSERPHETEKMFPFEVIFNSLSVSVVPRTTPQIQRFSRRLSIWWHSWLYIYINYILIIYEAWGTWGMWQRPKETRRKSPGVLPK